MSIGPVESLLLVLLFVAVPVAAAVVLVRWLAGVVRGTIRSEVRGPGRSTVREEYEAARRDLAGQAGSGPKRGLIREAVPPLDGRKPPAPAQQGVGLW